MTPPATPRNQGSSAAGGRSGWTRHGEQLVYDNRWVRVGLVDVERSDGVRVDYHVVHLDPIAVALVVDDRDRALMLWRYRFPVEQWGYELPGGLVEPGEQPAAAAARETLEETGWRVLGNPEPLARFEPLPGQLTAPVHAFLWRRAEQVGAPTDPEEVGRLEWVPLGRAANLARRGLLLGAGALVPLLVHNAKPRGPVG